MSLPTPKIKSSYRPEFQPYLKFVSFPDLDTIRGHQCAEPIRDILGQEVLYVIKWLQMVKGVKKVMKLKVLDSRYEPHKEEVIEDCIRDLNVEELDWRRTDLSIESIKSASPDVQTVHLYSGGDWTPLLHWMSVDGLNRLEDRVSETRSKDQITKISTWFETEWVNRRTGSDATPPFTVTAGAWGVDGPIENPTRTSTRFARTVMQLEDFVSIYQGVRRRRVERAKRYASANVPKPVRVAIIDTGINQNSFDLQKYHELNCRGEMFSETQDSHWWLSADSHGTQMAKLVTAIDPHCELYIAKVGDHKTDITRGAVSRAIRGAISEGADVISMSFALEPGDSQSMSELEKAIQAAAHEGIVMVCSTADEGENKPDALPAIYKETISIAACGSTGKPVDESNTTSVNFFFQGEDILHETFSPTASASSMTGSPLSVTTSGGGGDHHRGQAGSSSIERISGSSVATAIAAGVASLFLACCRLDGLKFDDTRRLKRVRKIFKAMTGTTIEQQNAKYVRPALVFETNGRGGNTPLIDPAKYHHLIVPQVEPTEDE
ncbi:hypothetical protein ANO14919_060020 [Xylariales sp. No.14919]|nr:hypothetical protein ANO14919_060020 [Xylariales sp. No.14919]